MLTFPTWLQHLSPFLPSTAAVDIVRTAYVAPDLAATWSGAWLPMLVLVGWGVVGAVL